MRDVEAIRKFSELGVDETDARVLVAMLRYRLARPKDELIRVLQRFPNLEDAERTSQAVDRLLQLPALQEDKNGFLYLSETAEIAAEPRFRKLIKDLYNVNPVVRVIGPPSNGSSYTGFLDLLSGSLKSVDLWISSASSYQSALDILSDRARSGVKVRVLLADPKLVASTRGISSSSVAHKTNASWRNAENLVPNLAVRRYTSSSGFAYSGSALIDQKILRINVFDHNSQRGMDGTLIEVHSQTITTNNLTELYIDEFDRAWARALPFGFWGIAKFLLSKVPFESTVLLIIISLYPLSSIATPPTEVTNILAGAAGSAALVLAMNWYGSFSTAIRRWLKVSK